MASVQRIRREFRCRASLCRAGKYFAGLRQMRAWHCDVRPGHGFDILARLFAAVLPRIFCSTVDFFGPTSCNPRSQS